MFDFKVGLISFMLPLAMCTLYLVARQLRRFVAYADNTTPPKERVKVYLALAAVMGFICGSGLQPTYDKAMQCKAESLPVVACTFFPNADQR